MPLDPQFIDGRDGLNPREREWLDSLPTERLRAIAAERPRDWSRSASIPNGVQVRKEAAERAYASKLLAARDVTA